MAENTNQTLTLEQRFEAMEKQMQDMHRQNENLQKIVSQQAKEGAALKEQLKKKEVKSMTDQKPKPTIPTQTFKVGGTVYRFLAAMLRIKAGNDWVNMTAQDALTDKAVLERLVATGSGLIAEVAD